MKYDFSGWATKNNLRCADGRTIRPGAFKENDGKTVPLVWNHQHNTPYNVLGHALLENRSEGIYAYCAFNDTDAGQNAKLVVEHGDVAALSIYANQLREKNGDVLHGSIKEVSLVLAGANPGAYIDSVIKHDDSGDEECIIYTDEAVSLAHGETLTQEIEHKEEPMADKDKKTVGDIVESMSDEQKDAMYFLIGQAVEDAQKGKIKSNDSDEEGEEDDMKHNVFDQDGIQNGTELRHGAELSHSEMQAIFSDAKRYGSLKESTLQHGIEQIDYLFPDAQTISNTPEFIARDMGWVSKVMNGVHHTPFSRVKSLFANITEDDARAKGYIKGNKKKEEVFSLLKRSTDPTTVYKKQKIDRDDVLDITDFDVVAWMKTEMRMMLNEEFARAYLVGDGRLASSDDKIDEQHIRPIWKDDDLFTIKATVDSAGITTADQKAKAFIRAAIRSRKDYKGSGEPIMFTTEDVITDCLLLEDNNGRVIYDSQAKLATALRVKEIVAVPVMEGLSRKDTDGNNLELMAIIVNLSDYNVGADKGGAVNMFDDFDIDYNAQKYLIESRCSGALIKPYSAIAIEYKTAASRTSATSTTSATKA